MGELLGGPKGMLAPPLKLLGGPAPPLPPPLPTPMLDEVAPYEPPYQDLRCLQIQLFSSLVIKELTVDLQLEWK